MSAVGETEGRIAIIGMAGRFPGAQDIATFWRNCVTVSKASPSLLTINSKTAPTLRRGRRPVTSRPARCSPMSTNSMRDSSTCVIAKRR